MDFEVIVTTNESNPCIRINGDVVMLNQADKYLQDLEMAIMTVRGFFDGVRDCERGERHKSLSDVYNSGYSAQYTREQLK